MADEPSAEARAFVREHPCFKYRAEQTDIALAVDAFRAAGAPKRHPLSEEEVARLEAKIKPIWLETQPSEKAQRIRSEVLFRLDEDSDWFDLVCDLFDIAAQRGIEAGARKPDEPSAEATDPTDKTRCLPCPRRKRLSIGQLVRFNHERDGGPVRRITNVAADDTVELHDMSGFFAPHLFEVADDIADIPPKLDDPEADATDAAHPAWWRGNDAGVAVTVARLADILDGKDDGEGVFGYRPLEALRRRILALATKPDPSDAYTSARVLLKLREIQSRPDYSGGDEADCIANALAEARAAGVAAERERCANKLDQMTEDAKDRSAVHSSPELSASWKQASIDFATCAAVLRDTP